MTTIVVADDEETIADLIAFALEMEGYQVFKASDGIEAIDLTQQHTPDLVVLDIMMPGVDGREASRRIKSDPATAHIPVLLVSAAPNPNLAESKADAFVAKPFDVDGLIETVHRLLDAHKKPASLSQGA